MIINLQSRVTKWLYACFGSQIAEDREERCDRFMEEAIELVQACGYEKRRIVALIDYVYSRPEGDVRQEVGGVYVTLAALCSAFGMDMEYNARKEIDRIEKPGVMEKIRAKQAAKPTGSALPIKGTTND